MGREWICGIIHYACIFCYVTIVVYIVFCLRSWVPPRLSMWVSWFPDNQFNLFHCPDAWRGGVWVLHCSQSFWRCACGMISAGEIFIYSGGLRWVYILGRGGPIVGGVTRYWLWIGHTPYGLCCVLFLLIHFWFYGSLEVHMIGNITLLYIYFEWLWCSVV